MHSSSTSNQQGNKIPTEIGLTVKDVSTILVGFIRAKYKLSPAEWDVEVTYPFIPECVVKIRRKVK